MSPTQRIFAAALALDGPARAAYLREQCAGDERLRAEVEELLRCDADARYLDETGLRSLRRDLAGDDEPLPERIGEFRVLSLLGRGGMSVVYRAEQERPRREVALKVLASQLVGSSGRARLLLEAEALGRLQHPGIAQVFAAGTFRSPTGEQPFLAMELVRGVTLQQWAQAAPRPLAERIRMVIAIAEAVSHAHQRGLVHRDLKPANVLVDEAGRCKVLDFGIARLLDLDGDAARQTRHGELLGTLAYMSPEQASGDAARVDVRTDVYSLGVIAYQLFTGALPIDVATDALPRGLRRIAEEAPRPLGERDRALRGDLQTIVACALRKEPDRRYAGMAAFADDLRRLLARRPIEARPATALYVLTRFAQRHALVLGAALAVVLGLVVALVVSVQAMARVDAARREEVAARERSEREAAEARRQEQQKSDVLAVLAEVFGSSDPQVNPESRHQPMATRLRGVMERFEQRFRDSPATERAVRVALASALVGRGEYADAIPHLRRVVDALPPGPPADDCQAFVLLAKAQWRVDALADALATLDRLAASAPSLAPQDDATVGCLRGQVLWKAGRRDEATQLWRRSLAGIEHAVDDASAGTAALLRSSLATALFEQKQFDAAAALVQSAIDDLTKAYGSDAEETLTALNSQAAMLFGQGDFARAAPLMEHVLRVWTHVYGEDHPGRVHVLQNYAATRLRLGEVDAAVTAFEQALAHGEKAFGADSPELSPVLSNLGHVRWQQKRLDEAAALNQRAIDLRLARRPEPDRLLSGYYYDLARIRRDQGDDKSHYELAQRSLAIRVAALGPFHELVLTRRHEMARLHDKHGRRRDAIAELRAIDEQVVAVLGAKHRAAIDGARLLATWLLDDGDAAAATPWIDALTARAAGTAEAAAAKADAERLAARVQSAAR
jgi:tetratricopeptide (TPR) repeat protein/predicted Ser/Thr protein kinase